MSNSSLLRIFVGIAALLGGACAGDIADTPEGQLEDSSDALKQRLPEIPEGLAVPAGHKLAFTLDAEGVQIYDCKTNAAGAAVWTFRAPDAELFSRRRFAGTHYAGPTWEALDGSTVVGARVAGVTVDSSAIPWLLLSGVSPDARGRMAGVTYIHRLETVGGLAPSSGCDATTLGDVAEVEYSALYAFYKQRGCGPR
ncbi:MAG TPA: DUF3455 domain-containing protein [Polyangiales bacterium]